MRIALISDFYLDYVGGAQSSIHEQQAALEAAGHTVFLVSCARLPRGMSLRAGDRSLQVRPTYTVPGVILPVVGASTALIRTLRHYFENNDIDVVHLQTEFGLAHAATSAAEQLGLPIVHTVHTFYWQSAGWWQSVITPALRFGLQNVTQRKFPRQSFTTRPSDNLLRNLTLSMAWRVDTVVSPSAHQAADLVAAGVDAPVVVVPNPIARSSRAPQPLTTTTALPRLLWVARCEPEKRPLVFAEAVLQALSETHNGFEVDFVGDGTELAALRTLTAGHPHIRVHGGLDHEAVIDLIDASSAVVLTSIGFDNQPMTIAEAVSRFRGVIYCDPKLSEGLQNAGELTRAADATGLASTIVSLVNAPERLIAMSEGAKHDSAVFSGETYVKRMDEVYFDALARVRSKPRAAASARLRLPPHA
ncbi:MAG TPA: glycosyltransferase family 4 protein [Glaciihabitans sp.]|jgi:glycosyltransferase involved in cell wall biosynthesis|nr:glycosyltransferase family 4 protein [Glaciihabitans sp.]